MFDTTQRSRLGLMFVLTLGPPDSGPHNMVLTADDHAWWFPTTS